MPPEEIRSIWDANAAHWDEYMGPHGNDFHRLLVAPTAERLLDLQAGERVLEIGCGAGIFARQMHERGAHVVATDFSEGFLARAAARLQGTDVQLQALDATDRRALASLGRFDAVVSNMVLMDMSDVAPLFAALPGLLVPGGRFVCTICHPCFNNDSSVRLMEQADVGGEVHTSYGVRTTRYRSLRPVLGIGVPGQPRPQYYFHRSIAELCRPAFAAGLTIDAIEEPCFPPSDGATMFAALASEIPMVLGLRFRR